MQIIRFIPLCMLAGSVVTGCASGPMPIAEYARARTLVEQAEHGDAQRFAAMDIGRAREKLYQAKTAMDARNAKMASRYSSEAALDAQLALARTSTAQAQKSASELDASIDELRAESQRNAGSQ